MTVPVRVLDASVGVKWFRNEAGSAEARKLLADHIEGRVVLAVGSLFFYEVLSVAARGHVAEDAPRVWDDLKQLDLVTVPLGDELLEAAVRFRAAHGCSLYDAFSAGLADLLDAPLFSADLRAHGEYARVIPIPEAGRAT